MELVLSAEVDFANDKRRGLASCRGHGLEPNGNARQAESCRWHVGCFSSRTRPARGNRFAMRGRDSKGTKTQALTAPR